MARSIPSGMKPKLPPLLTFAIVLGLLYVARQVLVPIALAILLSFLLSPLVERLERLRLPRPAAVLVIVGLSGLIIALMGWVVEQQAYQLAAKLPEYRTNILAKVSAIRIPEHGVLARASKTLSGIGEEISKPSPEAGPSATSDAEPVPPAPVPVSVVEPPASAWARAASFLRSLISPLATAGIVVVFTIFMLIKREDVRDRFIRLVGQRGMHQTTEALDDAAQRVSRYLLFQLIVNTSAGALIGLGLFFLGVPNAALWGLVVALLRFVPYVGIWISACLPILLSLAVSPGWTQPALTLGLFVVVEVICGNVVEPLLYGSSTGVSPLAILTAAVFWTWLWGGVGLLLSTPITVCLVVIGRHVPQMRFLSVMLGDEPPLPPEARFYQRVLAEDPEEAAQIVTAFAKDKPIGEVYDSLILPALKMAETDRHNGDLDEYRERSMADSLAALIEEIGDAPAAPSGADQSRPRGRVLCLPARDYADELAGLMLSKLLLAEGIDTEVLSAQALSGELLAAVAQQKPALVCISAVPPNAAVHVRVLAKRLRARFPELPMVVGIWDARIDMQMVREKIGTLATDRIVTTLVQAVDVIRPLVAAPLSSSTIEVTTRPVSDPQAGYVHPSKS